MRCPYCNKQSEWIPNEKIYGKRYGKSYMCYYCVYCGAYVGCHNNTKQPLGTMANAELRTWRIKAHDSIDCYWKSGKMRRQEVYSRLKELLGKEIHIGEADIEMCKKIIDVSSVLKMMRGE